jgi:CRP/FNR family cyclic AMP-dependent transcriptional regulator
MTIERTIRGHEMFGALSAKEVSLISGVSSEKHFEAGDVIYRHEGRVSHVFLNLEGQILLRLPAQSGEISLVISRVDPGELFGVAPLLGAERHTATAVAAEPSDVLAIEARPLREILQGNPVAGMQLIGRVARVYFDRYVAVMNSLQGVVNQISLIR